MQSLQCLVPSNIANTMFQMFRGRYSNTQLIVETVHLGTEEIWVEMLQAKIIDPFQIVEHKEE